MIILNADSLINNISKLEEIFKALEEAKKQKKKKH